ncbi:hypothetical protein BF95_07580 [Sphingobium sp. Ant17]|jgi:transposase|nr:hypothetical protein BF95_07580 [Sphingobium sp. Ant17]
MIAVSDAGLSTPDKDARIAELEAALAAAHADISARDILIDTLRVQIARLKRMQFGKSSEKLDTQIAQLELALEELEGEAIVAAARRGDPVAVDRPSPVRTLPAHLPREEQRIEPDQGNCTCPDCGGALRPLGQDSDEMLDAVPVQALPQGSCARQRFLGHKRNIGYATRFNRAIGSLSGWNSPAGSRLACSQR